MSLPSPHQFLPTPLYTCFLFLTLPLDVLASFPSVLSFLLLFIPASSFSSCLLLSLPPPHQFLPTPLYACFLFLTLPPDVLASSPSVPSYLLLFMLASSFLLCLLMSLPPPHQFLPTPLYACFLFFTLPPDVLASSPSVPFYCSLCLLPFSHPAS
jgi:hypothetical protein